MEIDAKQATRKITLAFVQNLEELFCRFATSHLIDKSKVSHKKPRFKQSADEAFLFYLTRWIGKYSPVV